jgi:hypothetical protein
MVVHQTESVRTENPQCSLEEAAGTYKWVEMAVRVGAEELRGGRVATVVPEVLIRALTVVKMGNSDLAVAAVVHLVKPIFSASPVVGEGPGKSSSLRFIELANFRDSISAGITA